MRKLDIVFEDKYLIVVNKPAKLLTIATNKNKEHNLYAEVYDYLHKKNQKVFIVNRLDKDTSGLVIFAKSEKIKDLMQNNWNYVIRKYYAIVDGIVEKGGVVQSYLKETKTLLTYSTRDKSGKYAKTIYNPLFHNNNYSLLDIEIKTGRKNQIRVQLANIKHPIVGDKKYGNKEKMPLCLQAYRLEFLHPITNKNIEIEIKLPKNLENLIK